MNRNRSSFGSTFLDALIAFAVGSPVALVLAASLVAQSDSARALIIVPGMQWIALALVAAVIGRALVALVNGFDPLPLHDDFDPRAHGASA